MGKQVVEINVHRQGVHLLSETLNVSEVFRSVPFGNLGEEMTLTVTCRELPDYPEPMEDGDCIMGYEEKKIEIVGKVSRHNSPRDKVDDAYWELLLAMVNAILDKVDFSSIEVYVR